MTRSIGKTGLLSLAALACPGALYAHEGHGWLSGAFQPLLGVDHLVATLFVVVSVSLALGALLARRPGRQTFRRR
ncbi:MAG: hypothetical protein R3195_19485 [Gemmatimonadota bacterium]|nr:hypothetical protein [Gemmatimonadota bacterium]